ncbi:transposase family protein [Micromonospora sp. NPDC050695]|uniref:transposase family protein n=1 Tax=Micromonospora sp. NPDC050695 TaxID=3154938 RepID=UPI00340A9914
MILVLTACATLVAGNDSVTAIRQWAARTPQDVLHRLGARFNPLLGRYTLPSERTFRRVLAGLDGDAIDAATCGYAADVVHGDAPIPVIAATEDEPVEREQRRAAGGDPARPDRAAARRRGRWETAARHPHHEQEDRQPDHRSTERPLHADPEGEPGPRTPSRPGLAVRYRHRVHRSHRRRRGPGTQAYRTPNPAGRTLRRQPDPRRPASPPPMPRHRRTRRHPHEQRHHPPHRQPDHRPDRPTPPQRLRPGALVHRKPSALDPGRDLFEKTIPSSGPVPPHEPWPASASPDARTSPTPAATCTTAPTPSPSTASNKP